MSKLSLSPGETVEVTAAELGNGHRALNVSKGFFKLRVIDLLRQDLFLLAGGLFFLSRDVLGSSWEFLTFCAKYRSC